MKLLHINAENPERKFISYAANEIKNGKLLIYPTDTVYGLGCSIKFENSIKKIFEIKKRNLNNPLSVAFSDLKMAKRYVLLSLEEEKFIKEHIDDPFTFIVKKKKNILDIITANRDKVGIRIPNHQIVKGLLSFVKEPIITTSANISGENAPSRVEEINKEIIGKVDLIIDSDPCKIGLPSKVIDLSTGEILRHSIL